MPEVVCLGEALIDFVAIESGVGVGDASGFVRAPGGAPANVAVGVARLGRSCAFLGKVGDDPFGHFLADTFAGAGVDIGGMVFSEQFRTGLAFVSLTAGGERDFCFFRNPSADMTYAPTELDSTRIASAKIFHFGSISQIDEPSGTTTLAAAEQARSNGTILSYDPNLRPPLWQSLETARQTILETLSLADMVKVSEEELGFLFLNRAPDVTLTEEEREGCIRQFHERYGSVELLMVTRGAQGCCWSTRHGLRGALPGLQVDVVDTTGAGDGFLAGVMLGLLKGDHTTPLALGQIGAEEWWAIFRFANGVGALTTTRKGAIPALPTEAEVSAFLGGNHAPLD